MTIQDVTSRISQIQSQLALLASSSASGVATASPAFAASMKQSLASVGTGTQTLPGTTTTGTGSAGGDEVVATARKYLGVPYVWGGSEPSSGLDCSGLIQHVYGELGYDIPRVSYQQAQAGRPVASLADAQPGDILAFGSPVHHVGIYVGNNQMIEAPRPGTQVRIGPVYETPTAIRRIVPDVATASGRVSAGTPYADLFNTASEKYGVSASLLSAVARQESGYNPTAVSSAGAQGLMQLMPATARGLDVANPLDPAQSVDGAARLLRSLLDRFDSPDLALAAYNAGPGAVLRYHGVPPYPETQHYVRSVLSMVEAS